MGPIRHVEEWPATILEIAPCKAYIPVGRFSLGPNPVVDDQGSLRVQPRRPH